ncbi:MAG: DUF1249 domain-containing protein [Proteobacteria bacterium]|nr:DUF1249 domain-containing protein [Pseudomonadota bacterium]
MSAILKPSHATIQRIPRMSRFAWMMALYAENHARLQRLLAPEALAVGSHASMGRDGLELRIDVVERHPYTIELQLSYPRLHDGSGAAGDPLAWIRHYRDAQQAEVTHCHVGRRWQDVLGLHPTLTTLIDHRMRMNVFFSKWLEYLGEQGHAPDGVHPRGGVAEVA